MQDQTLQKHMEDDRKFQEKFERIILGDREAGELGMRDKVDVMYDILVQSKGVIGFFGGVKGMLGFVIVFGAAIALIKGWFK